MEFNEKLQLLRKQKGLTQEELAEQLYVSRAAVSKWESGRGYPNIDSLKAIAGLFSVTIDELLSGDELLTIAEEDQQQKKTQFRDLTFGLLDLSSILLLFLPFFAQNTDGGIRAVSLLSLSAVSPCLKTACFALVAGIIATGVLTLALQNSHPPFWERNKRRISMIFSTAGTVLLIVSRQPYAAIFVFVFLMIKVFLLVR